MPLQIFLQQSLDGVFSSSNWKSVSYFPEKKILLSTELRYGAFLTLSESYGHRPQLVLTKFHCAMYLYSSNQSDSSHSRDDPVPSPGIVNFKVKSERDNEQKN